MLEEKFWANIPCNASGAVEDQNVELFGQRPEKQLGVIFGQPNLERFTIAGVPSAKYIAGPVP